MSVKQILGSIPPLLTGHLEFCLCGHRPSEHAAAAGCVHVHPANTKLEVGEGVCGCDRYRRDDRLGDGETFTRSVLQQVVDTESLPVERVDLEDALAVMFQRLWVASDRYDSRSHIRFSVYAYTALKHKAIDHFRADWGRNGHKRVFDPRNAEHDDLDGVGDESARTDRLGGAASRDPGDDPDAWAADAGGLLEVGDRPPARLDGRAGRAGVRRDAAGGPRPGVRDGRRARAEDARAGGAAPPRRAWVDCGVCGWRNYRQPPNGHPGWSDPEVCAGCGGLLTEPAAAAPNLGR